MDSRFDPIKVVAKSISDITISILDYVDSNPGIDGISILNQMCETYPNLSDREYFNDDVFFILDVLVDNGHLYFDFQEDSWYVVSNNPETC